MPNFVCEICDFVCCKESNMKKHLSTRKHHGNLMETGSSSKKMPKNAETPHDYRCEKCDRNRFFSKLLESGISPDEAVIQWRDTEYSKSFQKRIVQLFNSYEFYKFDIWRL